jgi:hypothetical protein
MCCSCGGDKKHIQTFDVKTPLKVGFEVLTAVSTKMAVIWVVAPCSLVEVYQRFRGPCCLHHQDDSPLPLKVATWKISICEYMIKMNLRQV